MPREHRRKHSKPAWAHQGRAAATAKTSTLPQLANFDLLICRKPNYSPAFATPVVVSVSVINPMVRRTLILFAATERSRLGVREG